MTRANEGSQWLTLRRYQGLFEGNAFIAWQHRFADADQSVTCVLGRDMGDLIAARFSLLADPPR